MENSESVVQYLRSLGDKELAEIFYATTRDRSASDLAEAKGHWVVGVVALENGRWSLDVISEAAKPAYGSSEWAPGSPVCQWGVCEGCGFHLRSWAKQMSCPVCRSVAHGS